MSLLASVPSTDLDPTTTRRVLELRDEANSLRKFRLSPEILDRVASWSVAVATLESEGNMTSEQKRVLDLCANRLRKAFPEVDL